MINISANLQKIQQEIYTTERRYQRERDSVKLLAVSKAQPVGAIQAAIVAGQYLFGENYLQEALVKIQAIQDPRVEWHYIGHVQSNKTKAIAENFYWVHSVAQFKIAKRLNDQRPQHLSALQVCMQVNVDDEASKDGVSLAELPELALEIAKLPNLKLRGLMAIPAKADNFQEQRLAYRKMRLALEHLQKLGLAIDTLSMGMSNDFQAAIAEGATIVRIGTAIFGERDVVKKENKEK